MDSSAHTSPHVPGSAPPQRGAARPLAVPQRVRPDRVAAGGGGGPRRPDSAPNPRLAESRGL